MNDDFWDIAVFVEHQQEKLTRHSKGLLTKARELSNMLGCYLKAITLSKGDIQQIIYCGADKVFIYKTSPSDAIIHFVENEKPEILLFHTSESSLSIAPLIAHRFQTGLCSCSFDVYIDTLERKLICKTLKYNKKLVVEYKINGYPQIACLLADKLPEPYEDKTRTGEITEIM